MPIAERESAERVSESWSVIGNADWNVEKDQLRAILIPR